MEYHLDSEAQAYKTRAQLQGHGFTGRITWFIPAVDTYGRPHPCFGEAIYNCGYLVEGREPERRSRWTRAHPKQV